MARRIFRLSKGVKKTRDKLIVCGDYNIAYKEIDLHNPASNKKTTGFLPDERAWFDKFLANGFVDGFRQLNKEPHQYSWWNVLRPTTRFENKGWRIDYINVTENLKDRIIDVKIYPEVKQSNHCPHYAHLFCYYLAFPGFCKKHKQKHQLFNVTL